MLTEALLPNPATLISPLHFWRKFLETGAGLQEWNDYTFISRNQKAE